MRVTSLGSGSSGNALLVEAGPQRRTKLLVDAGLSGRVLIERLRQVHVHPAQLQGVVITHEHSDHILGLPALLKYYTIPLITVPDTLSAIEQCLASGWWRTDSGTLIPPQIDADIKEAMQGPHSVALQTVDAEPTEIRQTTSLRVGSPCMIGDIEVLSFPVSHDAVAPCGYLLSAGGCRVCVVLDSGEVTTTMLDAMQQADLLILESNHDRERLLRGPYPYHLKQRILSSSGHLSNDQAADAILRTWRTDSVRWLWLSHLSRTNNTPKLALKSMVSRLEAAQANLFQIHISVLPPGMGEMWDSTQLWHTPSLWDMQW